MSAERLRRQIEVITYDELERIADNIVHSNLDESGWKESETGTDDIPF